MEMPDATILSSRLPRVERKAPRKNRCASQGCLAHLHSIRLFFPVIVPVVQRTEQGFPKAKTAFLLDFASVISSEQMTGFKRVE